MSPDNADHDVALCDCLDCENQRRAEETHLDDERSARQRPPDGFLFVVGLARGIELALQDGVPVSEREQEIKMLLRMLRELAK